MAVLGSSSSSCQNQDPLSSCTSSRLSSCAAARLPYFLPSLLPAATRIACFFWGNLPWFANSRVCVPTTAFSIFHFFYKKNFLKKNLWAKRKIHLPLLSPKKEETNKTKTKTKLKNKAKYERFPIFCFVFSVSVIVTLRGICDCASRGGRRRRKRRKEEEEEEGPSFLCDSSGIDSLSFRHCLCVYLFCFCLLFLFFLLLFSLEYEG